MVCPLGGGCLGLCGCQAWVRVGWFPEAIRLADDCEAVEPGDSGGCVMQDGCGAAVVAHDLPAFMPARVCSIRARMRRWVVLRCCCQPARLATFVLTPSTSIFSNNGRAYSSPQPP